MPYFVSDNNGVVATQPAVAWTRSTRSMANGNCVEVAGLPGAVVGVRDSKNPGGHVLHFTPGQWNVFLGAVRHGSGTASQTS